MQTKSNEVDELQNAIVLVLDLAYQNTADRLDMPAEYRRQMAALKLVRSTFSRNGEPLW